jgi:hypothetical protein
VEDIDEGLKPTAAIIVDASGETMGSYTAPVPLVSSMSRRRHNRRSSFNPDQISIGINISIATES